jgi:hypothetical protein
MIHNITHIIPAALRIAADIPLCTETIMAKDRITMIMAITVKTLIFHIITIVINTALIRAGTVIIKAPGLSMTEIMIILLMRAIIALSTETTANITMATTGATTAPTAGIIMTDLTVNNRPF